MSVVGTRSEPTRRVIANRRRIEDHLLETEWFRRFERQLGETDLQIIETLLQGVRVLAANFSAARLIVITGALVPGSMWLLGRYPMERVARFRDERAEVVLPLHPLHVYLGGDPTTVPGRAVSERGTAFRDRSSAPVKNRNVPHYPDGPRPSDVVGSLAPTALLDATLPIAGLLQLLWEQIDSGDQTA